MLVRVGHYNAHFLGSRFSLPHKEGIFSRIGLYLCILYSMWGLLKVVILTKEPQIKTRYLWFTIPIHCPMWLHRGKKSVCLNIFSSLRNFIFFGITSEQFYNLGFLMNYMGTKWQNIDDSKVPWFLSLMKSMGTKQRKLNAVGIRGYFNLDTYFCAFPKSSYPHHWGRILG